MRHVSDKKLYRKSKHALTFKFFSPESLVYEIMWKNMVKPDRSQITYIYDAENMSFSYRITSSSSSS